jgi:hypothetical protein
MNNGSSKAYEGVGCEPLIIDGSGANLSTVYQSVLESVEAELWRHFPSRGRL